MVKAIKLRIGRIAAKGYNNVKLCDTELYRICAFLPFLGEKTSFVISKGKIRELNTNEETKSPPPYR